MDSSMPNLQSQIFNALCGLLLSLAFGPWLTVGGLSVLRDPSRIEEKSLVIWPLRWGARDAKTERQIRFWACMALLVGVVGDFTALLTLWALIEAIANAMVAH